MEESIGHRPSKRLKINHEQRRCTTFGCLSGELLLDLFEYFNTYEIFQSFSNLTPLITSCIFDQRQQLHLHLDRQMPYLHDNFFPNQVISLHIGHVAIPIDTFINLKSLCIAHGNEREEECLNMVKQIVGLTQIVNFTLSLVGSELTLIGHKMIEISLCHPSLQRIILSKTDKSCSHSSYTTPSVKLIFPSVKLVHVSDDFHGRNIRQLRYRVGNGVPERIQPQYHVRCLNLDSGKWRMYLLFQLLPYVPLLVELKVNGCGQTRGWLYVNIWDRMLQNLKALQRVAIDIYICWPTERKDEIIQDFNENAAQKIQTCKRMNLTLGTRTKYRGRGCFQLSASLNMD